MAYSWRCPFCNQNATISEGNESRSWHTFNCGNKFNDQVLISHAVVCPNPDCKEYSLSASLHDRALEGTAYKTKLSKMRWQLIPAAETKVFPDYIPTPIIGDYKEACLIRDLSPKASATLSRRCLQGMIRDFWGISKSRLVDEVEALEEKVDPVTWSAIDAVRKIGNIGAHMEKDINIIIDVDAEEASLLIGLIETLINDWYIVKHEREERLKRIISVSSSKVDQKSKANQNDSGE